MGVVHAGNRFRHRGAHYPGIHGDLRLGVELMLCDPGSPDAGTPHQPGNEAGRNREGEGCGTSIPQGPAWPSLTSMWRHSCFAVQHRLKEAEERAERLAQSFGVRDDG